MKKEIQVLYDIFELELAPPFKLAKHVYSPWTIDMFNQRSEVISQIHTVHSTVKLIEEKETSILSKVKQVFNANNLSNEDVYHIAKHLFNWFQDKFPRDIESIRIWNDDTETNIDYP